MTMKTRLRSLPRIRIANDRQPVAPAHSARRLLLAVLLLPACLSLSACDLFGEEAAARAEAAKDAEGRAIGSGCRLSGRSLEDCYTQNPRALKASVFAGWRDMDGYMRENNIAIVPPPDYRAVTEIASPATPPAEAPTATAPGQSAPEPKAEPKAETTQPGAKPDKADKAAPTEALPSKHS